MIQRSLLVFVISKRSTSFSKEPKRIKRLDLFDFQGFIYLFVSFFFHFAFSEANNISNFQCQQSQQRENALTIVSYERNGGEKGSGISRY